VGFVEALNLVGQSLTLAIGLQFIGWAKHRARVALDEWKRTDGPRNRELLQELQRLGALCRDNAQQASAGIRDALAQVRSEVR
jgi:hypothetical protein